MARTPHRSGRLLTSVLVVLTAGAGVGGLALVGWAAWQGAGSASAATAQQRAGASAEASWRPAPVPATAATVAIPVAREPAADAATVATVRVPRFGASWVRTVRQGAGEDVLDSFDAGVGHYPGTAMPGGVGNFAIAGHDTGWGDAFRRLGDLRVGDPMVVSDAAGVYTYAFRNFRWVQPAAVEVLLPVPERPDARIGARLITLTTCDPPYHAEERFVAYGELVAFRPHGAAASSPPSVPAASRAQLAALRSALTGVERSPARLVDAVRRAGFAGAVEVTADRTSVGRPVPAVQVGVRLRGRCLLGQVSASGVRTTAAPPVAGRCLIGSVARSAAAP